MHFDFLLVSFQMFMEIWFINEEVVRNRNGIKKSHIGEWKQSLDLEHGKIEHYSDF